VRVFIQACAFIFLRFRGRSILGWHHLGLAAPEVFLFSYRKNMDIGG
jgi:hypothetical protein